MGYPFRIFISTSICYLSVWERINLGNFYLKWCRGRGSRALLKWFRHGALVHDACYHIALQLEGPEVCISFLCNRRPFQLWIFLLVHYFRRIFILGVIDSEVVFQCFWFFCFVRIRKFSLSCYMLPGFITFNSKHGIGAFSISSLWGYSPFCSFWCCLWKCYGKLFHCTFSTSRMMKQTYG